jgi:hypothetical protein
MWEGGDEERAWVEGSGVQGRSGVGEWSVCGLGKCEGEMQKWVPAFGKKWCVDMENWEGVGFEEQE